MIALVATLLLGQLDGGTAASSTPPPIEQLYKDCPTDAPLATWASDGQTALVPIERVRRQVCREAACENYATAKLSESQSPPQLSTVLWMTGAGLSLFLAGLAAGAVATGWKP